MTTMFGGSRLANLREKRTSGDENVFKKEESLKLTLLADETQKSSYEPSSSSSSFMSRTQTRLLKGRIEKPHAEQQDRRNSNENKFEPSSMNSWQRKDNINSQNLKLVIHDDPPKDDKTTFVQTNPMRTTQKRILIAKDPERQSEIRPIEPSKSQPLKQTPQSEPQKPTVFNQDKPIKEEDVEESMQCENDLIECPEGCGRKFNRKALEKHAKACKLVFMSKRKQFNSEAKRLVAKEQAALAKQKEKMKKTGNKQIFQKTSDNWKQASENFRAAVKAVKKQQKEQGQEEEGEMKILQCQYCNKPFAQVFLQKHLLVCVSRKEQKKKTNKKK